MSPKLFYLHFTLILRKLKIISGLTLSILTLMNIHSPPSSLTVFSIANTHVRTSKSHMIKVLVTALEVLEVVEVDVLEGVEDDAIFDLRPEGPSRRAISVVA